MRPLLVTATGQFAGRGRGAAVWQNAPRALAASIAFRPVGWPSASSSLITLLAGIAATEVIEDADLKWPNDVMVSSEKVAGVLGESVDGVIIVGMGVNLWWPAPPSGFGAAFSDDPGVGEGRLLAERWAVALLALVDGGPDRWPIDRYRSLCSTIGAEVTWEPEGRGRATDVDRSGALVVETESGTIAINAGAVRHVRPS